MSVTCCLTSRLFHPVSCCHASSVCCVFFCAAFKRRYLLVMCVQDARFSIQPMTGAITLVAPLDYESMLASAAYYRLLVRVTDSGNPALSGCVQRFLLCRRFL